MRETTQYREMAEWLAQESESFMNKFPWYSGLTPAQRAVHKVSQLLNTDCHNGYSTNILRTLAGADTFRLQHQQYNNVIREVSRDSDNHMKSSDVLPRHILLRRLTLVDNYDHYVPEGKLNYEMRGTLFCPVTGGTNRKMQSICKDSLKKLDFDHPWYWTVPTTDQILNVFAFCKQSYLDEITGLYNRRDSVSTQVKEAFEKAVAKIPSAKSKPTEANVVEDYKPTIPADEIENQIRGMQRFVEMYGSDETTARSYITGQTVYPVSATINGNEYSWTGMDADGNVYTTGGTT